MSFCTHPTQPLTSIYHKEPLSASKGRRQLLIFIPGNPGLIDYYTTYLELVQQKYPSLEILNISHAGFQTTGDFVKDGESLPFVFYNLEFQIDHKVNIIKEFVLESVKDDEQIDIFWLCHSVGAFITQRVIQKLLKDPEVKGHINFKFIGLICPTILDIKISSKGVLFSRFFALFPFITLVLIFTSLLRFLPSSWVKQMIRYHLANELTHSDKDAKNNMENTILASYHLFSSQRIIRQALTLAEEELKEISQHDEINNFFFNDLTEKHNIKIWSFFADLDYWVHDNVRDSILSKYHFEDNKNLKFELGQADSITHSFCVDQNKEFADITCSVLDSFFDKNLQ